MVSCTGVVIPSLDAHLIDEMVFVATCAAAITELGCSAGAPVWRGRHDFLRGFPTPTCWWWRSSCPA